MEQAFCPNFSNKLVKREFDELKRIFGEDTAYFLWNKNNGHSLDKAPNGALSKLYSDLILLCRGDIKTALRIKAQTYTNAFTKGISEDYSKIGVKLLDLCDENGELNAHTVIANTNTTILKPLVFSNEPHNEFYKREKVLAEQEAARISNNVRLFGTKDKWLKQRDEILATYHIKFPDFKLEPKYHNPNMYNDNDNRYYEFFLPTPIDLYLKENKNSVNRWTDIINKAIEKSKDKDSLDRQSIGMILTELVNQTMGCSKYIDELSNMIRSSVHDMISRYGIKMKFKIDENISNSELGARCIFENNTYTILINPNALFRNEDDFRNTLALSMLHEMLHVVTEAALRNDKKLQAKAEKLLREVRVALGEDSKFYGLKDIYEFFAELSNRQFLNALNNIKYTKEENSHKNIVDKIKDLIHSLLRVVFEKTPYGHKLANLLNITQFVKVEDNALSEAYDLLAWACLPIDNKVFHEDTERRQYDIGTQLCSDDIKERLDNMNKSLYEQYDILHKYYERMKNKNKRLLKLQDLTFDLLQQLKLINKTLTDIAAFSIQESLDFGLLTIGTIDNVTGLPTNDNCLIAYLKQQKEKNFEDITNDELIDIYKSVIKFYENLLSETIPTASQVLYNVRTNLMLLVLNRSISDLKSLWKDALEVAVNNIIDETVDNGVVSSDEDKEHMKTVLRDYFGRHAMYGDLNIISAYMSSLPRSQSPIIKMAFDIILQQETLTNEEFNTISNRLNNKYKSVSKITRANPNWQKVMIEFDRDGVPTGYFIRPVNYGQYKIDLENFIEDLNKKWVEKYGFSYERDPDTGEYVRSDTGVRSDEEEWIDGEMPMISKYMLEIYNWKTLHANLQYTYQYYYERLSTPFNPDDNITDEESYLNTHHGLSPRTLNRYNHIQANINYYLSKLYKNGEFTPEDFTEEDEAKLDMWYAELDLLSNIYQPDGTIKSDDTVQMAYELRAWQKWISGKIGTTVDENQYYMDRDALNEKINLAIKSGDENKKIEALRAFNLFMKYNSSYQIDPELRNYLQEIWNKIEKSSTHLNEFSPDMIVQYSILKEKIERGMLNSISKDHGNTTKEKIDGLNRVKNNLNFFVNCKRNDELISEYNMLLRQEKLRLEKDSTLNIQIKQGNDLLFGYINKELVPSEHNPEETYFDNIIKYYLDVIRGGWSDLISGVFTDLNNKPVDFSQKTDNEVIDYLKDFFSYETWYFDRDFNQWVPVKLPLSVFYMLRPKLSTWNRKAEELKTDDLDMWESIDTRSKVENDPKNNRLIMGNYPAGRYSHKTNAGNDYIFINEDYNQDESYISELPMLDLYDNQEAYDKALNTCGDLYLALINAMKDAQGYMGLYENGFNYKLPKMESSDVVIAKRAFTTKNVNPFTAIAELFFNVNTNEAYERSTGDEYVGPDGEKNQNIPLKYIGTLKDRYKYTYNIHEAVLMYIASAIDYKNKNKVLSKLQALLYIQQKENKKQTADVDAELERNTYNYMMRKYMYQTVHKNTPSWKVAKWTKNVAVFQMLAFNFLSMNAGLYDSLRSIIRDSLCARYFNIFDFFPSVIYNITRLPLYIANLGHPIANTKLMAINRRLGIHKNTIELAKTATNNRIADLLGGIFMNVYGAIDFMTTNIILHSVLNHYKFYDGGIIPTGFYRLHDMKVLFKLAGHNGIKAAYEYSKLRRSLWGAYKFNSKDGSVDIKDEYKQYVSLRLKNTVRGMVMTRAEIDNGTTPKNGTPKYADTIAGSYALTMRGFMVGNFTDNYGGRDDVSVREFDEKGNKKPRTGDLRRHRMAWNYSTGLPEQETMKALWRSISMIGSSVYNYFRHRPENIRWKLSTVEAFAIKTVLIQIGILLALVGNYKYVDDWCKDVNYGTRHKETPDITNFFNRKLYKEWVRNGYIRMTNSALELMDPSSMMDVVNSITTLKTAVDNVKDVPFWLLTGDKTSLDVFDFNSNQLIKQGKYIGFDKGEGTLWKAIGPLNNLLSGFTYNGNASNTSWYSRTYSWWLNVIDRKYKPFTVPKVYHQKNEFEDFDDLGIDNDFDDFNGFD